MNFVFAKIVRDGGKGNGNFGHKGRPGQVGGSSKEDEFGCMVVELDFLNKKG